MQSKHFTGLHISLQGVTTDKNLKLIFWKTKYVPATKSIGQRIFIYLFQNIIKKKSNKQNKINSTKTKAFLMSMSNLRHFQFKK